MGGMVVPSCNCSVVVRLDLRQFSLVPNQLRGSRRASCSRGLMQCSADNRARKHMLAS